MGWLQGVEVRPGVPPKAWLVVPGLREHFAERQKHAEAARAEAHAILKSRRQGAAGADNIRPPPVGATRMETES